MECIQCRKIITGRIDKMFCSDGCRNKYNNLLNRDATNYVRNINHILRKNRRILESVLQKNKFTQKQELLALGFDFDHHTSQTLSRSNHSYTYCYEFGYMQLENGLFVVVKKK